MEYMKTLEKRRSYYHIDRNINVSEKSILKTIDTVTSLVPDATNMQSARVVVALGDYQDKLWNAIYDVFDGQVKREKIDSFRAGYGTVLFYIDGKTVAKFQDKYPLYAENYNIWAQQANGMLQISIWSALRDLGLGASLQHYNPVIDDKLRKLFDIPEDWILLAQMPFGNILEEPDAKKKMNIRDRVKVWP